MSGRTGDRTEAAGRSGRIVLAGGLTVGALDGLAACVSAWLARGTTPERVFQSVASGWLGRASFDGGLATAALGLAIHFLIALSVATVYLAAATRVAALRERPLLAGPFYGVAVFLFMYYVVMPLSAIGWPRLDARGVITAIVIHVFAVGLPAAIFGARAARVRRAGAAAGPPHPDLAAQGRR